MQNGIFFWPNAKWNVNKNIFIPKLLVITGFFWSKLVITVCSPNVSKSHGPKLYYLNYI